MSRRCEASVPATNHDKLAASDGVKLAVHIQVNIAQRQHRVAPPRQPKGLAHVKQLHHRRPQVLPCMRRSVSDTGCAHTRDAASYGSAAQTHTFPQKPRPSLRQQLQQRHVQWCPLARSPPAGVCVRAWAMLPHAHAKGCWSSCRLLALTRTHAHDQSTHELLPHRLTQTPGGLTRCRHASAALPPGPGTPPMHPPWWRPQTGTQTCAPSCCAHSQVQNRATARPAP